MDLKYLKHAAFYFFTAVLSIILIYYIGYHLFDGFAQNISVVSAEKVTQNHTVTLSGYVIREEQYVYSTVTGEVGYLCGDGDKVASAMQVAHVYAVTNPAVRAKIKELDEKIALYQSSNAAAGITMSDTTVIDRRISRLYLLLKNALNVGDAEYVYRKQNELLILLNQRKIITHSVVNYNDKIEALEREKRQLTQSLSGVTETVTVPRAGFFYSQVDGYETVFSSSVLDSLTVEQFDRMIEAEPSVPQGGTQGYPIGKLVTDYKWQVVCPIALDQVRYFLQGEQYEVVFPYNGDASVTMTLTSLLSDLDLGRALLVFESGSRPENFHYLRMQTVNIVRENYEGFRVPIGAIRLVDGVQGVYIMHGSYVRFRAVEPLYEDDGYLIVACENLTEREDDLEWLGMYEDIIVEGKDLYDGKIIH